MIKRQQRIEWIAAVAREYLAAKSAADLLATQLQADPNYGRQSRLGSPRWSRLQGESGIDLHRPAIC